MSSKEKINDIIVENNLKQVKQQLNYEKALYSRNQENVTLIKALQDAGVENSTIKGMLNLENLDLTKFNDWNNSVIEKLEDVISLMESEGFKALSVDLQNSVLKSKRFITVEKVNEEIESEDKTKE